jgi:hypothetical protein
MEASVIADSETRSPKSCGLTNLPSLTDILTPGLHLWEQNHGGILTLEIHVRRGFPSKRLCNSLIVGREINNENRRYTECTGFLRLER